MWPFKRGTTVGRPNVEQRLQRLEDAFSKLGGIAEQFTNFASRITLLEEGRTRSSEMFQRAFDRLETVEVALKGDGTDSNPGMYATQLVVKKDVENVTKKLDANTSWTRSIALAIVIGILAWAGNTLLAASRAPTPTTQGP